MKKWYDEEYRWTIEVIGYLRGSGPERVCRNGEEVGDVYTCTYGCPVNAEGQGICAKAMMVMFPVMEAVRSGGDLQNIGGSGPVHQGDRMPGRQRHLSDDSPKNRAGKLFPRQVF